MPVFRAHAAATPSPEDVFAWHMRPERWSASCPRGRTCAWWTRRRRRRRRHGDGSRGAGPAEAVVDGAPYGLRGGGALPRRASERPLRALDAHAPLFAGSRRRLPPPGRDRLRRRSTSPRARDTEDRAHPRAGLRLPAPAVGQRLGPARALPPASAADRGHQWKFWFPGAQPPALPHHRRPPRAAAGALAGRNRRRQRVLESRAREVEHARLEGVDAIVHLAGEPLIGVRWTEAKKREILRSRRDGTEWMAHPAARLSPPPRVLVCASAVGYTAARQRGAYGGEPGGAGVPGGRVQGVGGAAPRAPGRHPGRAPAPGGCPLPPMGARCS